MRSLSFSCDVCRSLSMAPSADLVLSCFFVVVVVAACSAAALCSMEEDLSWPCTNHHAGIDKAVATANPLATKVDGSGGLCPNMF